MGGSLSASQGLDVTVVCDVSSESLKTGAPGGPFVRMSFSTCLFFYSHQENGLTVYFVSTVKI